ncbi:MAG: glutaredoxin family protein [Myxococcus sp.]|nr:glutaredoxin family protein [Myxococcus sp.]
MHLLVYRKPGCPLCDDAEELLDAAREKWRFTVEARNIFEQDEWYEAYRYRVPVVVVNGTERLELRFSAQELDAALAAAQES